MNEAYYNDMTRAQLSAHIAELDGQLGDAIKRSELASDDLTSLLISEKESQLAKIRKEYGSVKIGSDLNRAVVEFARIQGMEAVAMADQVALESAGPAVKNIRNSIDIAKRVMQQKETMKKGIR